MEKLNDQITVVIRSSGERTEETCYKAVSGQVSEENIFVIRESPFSQAVRKTYQIGTQQGKKWTLALDADILLKKDAIAEMVNLAEQQQESLFELQGVVLDELFCLPRKGGPHLYRTSLLEEALAYIPEEGDTLRPETEVFLRMIDRGYSWYQGERIYGIHDYYQFYRDIFRKCFLLAHKQSHIAAYLQEQWKKRKEDDFDYQVAVWGFNAGKVHDSRVYVDVGFFKEEIDEVFSIKNVIEKEPIKDHDKLIDKVEEQIEAFSVEEDQKEVYYKYIHIGEPVITEKKEGGQKGTTFLNRGISKFGGLLIRTGNYLKRIAEAK